MREQLPSSRVLEGVTPYHWLVVAIASCGWLFDCMDQRIFVLARESALRELLRGDAEALASIKSAAIIAPMSPESCSSCNFASGRTDSAGPSDMFVSATDRFSSIEVSAFPVIRIMFIL